MAQYPALMVLTSIHMLGNLQHKQFNIIFVSMQLFTKTTGFNSSEYYMLDKFNKFNSSISVSHSF